MTRLRPAALLLLAALPGAAWAACNPIGTEDCCMKIETPECEEVDWPEADGVDVSGTCSSVAFELVGLTPGRYTKKTTVEWIANDPSVECPTNQIRLEEFTFEANVTWRITENGVTVKTGGGTFAESPDPVSGSIGCTFTLSSDAGICGENTEDYSASTNLPVASVSIPSIVGSNDLVEPCEDEVDPVTSVEELHDDEDDLYNVTWSCSPDPEEVTIWSTTPQKLQIHVDKEGTLAHVYHYPEMSRTEPIWAEGLLRSVVPNDAVVKMLYKVNGVTCETSNACTVVSVDLDKDAYNRMDPFPQVEITQVENLVTGQTATVHYRVLPDLATPEGAVLQATFRVSSEPGTHEWRTPPFENRFGNKGWDALRYTVYVEANGARNIRKAESMPSEKALVFPPASCLATINGGDALAADSDAFFSHLQSIPNIQMPREAEEGPPDWKVKQVKLFKKAAKHYYKNEMVLAELGTTAVREILWNETQDTAVGLELTCDPVVCVNDLYEDGDPGDNAATNQVWTDPDFIGPVKLDGLPECIRAGTYYWEISGGANLVIQEGGGLFVGKSYTGNYAAGIKCPKVEGRESSTDKEDVEIRFRLETGSSTENPKAFRAKTFPAFAKLTVADTRWTISKPDGEAGRSPERTDLLSCDLDLRPCIALASFNPVFATNLAVSGVVTSMCDIVRDIRVNGAQVPMTNIRFRDESVENFNDATIKEKTWGLDPPYVVTFDYTIPDFRTNVVFVEALGTRTAVPGSHRTAVSFPINVAAGTNGLCGAPQADPVSKNLSFEDFYRQDWDFLYKFEVDHAGSGSGILECQPDLTCGSQGIDREYHRLELPMLFFPPDTPPAISRIGKGFLTNLVDRSAVTGRYETATGRDSISKLFPCQLTVYGMDNRPVPDCDEWWLGAFATVGSEVRLEPVCPELPAGRSETAKITLKKTRDDPAGGGSDAVFPDFTEIVWTGRTGVETQTLHPATSGVAEFELSIESDLCTSKDRVRVTVIGIDLDIDSDNNDEFGGPSRTDEEDACEDPAQGSGEFGRILIVDDDNKDSDTVPDFVDGYDFFAEKYPGDSRVPDSRTNLLAQFVPIVFELPGVTNVDDFVVTLDYPESKPFDVYLDENDWYVRPETGNLRLWRKEGKEPRRGKSIADGGDFVASGEYPARQFGFSEFTQVVTNYVEAIQPSKQPGDLRIVFGVRPAKGSYSQSVTNDAVVVTALQFGLIPDWNRDGAIDGDDRQRLERKGVFRFWINDDHDGDVQEYVVVSSRPVGSRAIPVYGYRSIDNSGFATDAQFDSPEGSYLDGLPESVPKTPNCRNGRVDSVRDIVDFFPVQIELADETLSLSEDIRWRVALSHGEAAVNYALTSLEKSKVSELFHLPPKTGFGENRDESASTSTVIRVVQSPTDISLTWLSDTSVDRRVVMVEGRECSSAPLEMCLFFGGKNVGSWSLALSLSSVQDMMRYLNERHCDSFFTTRAHRVLGTWRTWSVPFGKWESRLDPPSNLPDGYYFDKDDEHPRDRTFIAVHGLDWDESETPAGNSEIFKRLFQSGLNSRFIGTSWSSEIARYRYSWKEGPPIIYGDAVIGAFVVARYLKEDLGDFLGANATVLAHSLGNVVVSSMVKDHGAQFGHYLMLNAAAPRGAYIDAPFQHSIEDDFIIHPSWRDYPKELRSTDWHRLFQQNNPSDNRRFVTWESRFSGIPNIYQFYSTGEEILHPADTSDVPKLFIGDYSVAGANEYVWVYNEMTKGMGLPYATHLLPKHSAAGWGFQTAYDVPVEVTFPPYEITTYRRRLPSEISLIQNPDWVDKPFFKEFNTSSDSYAPLWDDTDWFWQRCPNWIYKPVGDQEIASRLPPIPSSGYSMNLIKNHAKLLAEQIPPLTNPAGSRPIENCSGISAAFNMPSKFMERGWPTVRLEKSEKQAGNKRWLHGDYKDAPYNLVWKLYDMFVKIDTGHSKGNK